MLITFRYTLIRRRVSSDWLWFEVPMIITACQSKSSTIIPVFLQPHISSHWKHSLGCHPTECLTAVCLDRIGAAATANCREKFGWPDIKAILADFAVLIWNVHGEKMESLKLVKLEIDKTNIPCFEKPFTNYTMLKHPISFVKTKPRCSFLLTKPCENCHPSSL